MPEEKDKNKESRVAVLDFSQSEVDRQAMHDVIENMAARALAAVKEKEPNIDAEKLNKNLYFMLGGAMMADVMLSSHNFPAFITDKRIIGIIESFMFELLHHHGAALRLA